ncbi:MAG: caspase domain-containing protein [Hyphomicrobiales bacterium]
MRLLLISIAAAFAAAALFLCGTVNAQAQQRHALVIGNSQYRSVAQLPNPVRDAEAMRDLLKSAGFQVITALDLGQSGMREAVREFADSLSGASSDSVVMVYFAGHGVQIDGENFLLPVDANIGKESDVALEGVRLADLMNMLDGVPARTRIVILDACRNNPFDSIRDATGRGLSIVNAPAGTIVAYSTSPGATAEDGTGGNSPFTGALVETARQPGMPIETVFQTTRLAVHKVTQGRQTPWEVSALTEPFSFFDGGAPAASAPEKSQDDWRKELGSVSAREAYDIVVIQNDVTVYEIFVTLWPDTLWAKRLRALMERRIEMMAWFEAVSLNTSAAFEAFLARYPESDLIQTAARLSERARTRELTVAKLPESARLDLPKPDAELRTVVKEVVKEVPVTREVVREVQVPVVKEVVKEVRVPVVKEVVKEVVREVKVPVVKEVVKTVQVPVVREVVKTVRVPVPVPCKCGGGGGGTRPPTRVR